MAFTAIPDPGVVGHALTALGHHITQHQLPAPGDITVEADHIAINVEGFAAVAWRRSIVDVTFTREPAIRGSRLEWVTASGRLPDTGVRVQLSWLRTTRLIQGASA